MGYNTIFELVVSDDIDKQELANKLFNILNTDDNGLPDDNERYVELAREQANSLVYDGEYYGRWYSYMNDMKKLSALYPSRWWLLTGTGDDSGSTWKAYFLNGKGHKYTDDEFVDWLVDKLHSTKNKLRDAYVRSNLT